MRVRMAADLCQRIVSAEAKLSFPLFAFKVERRGKQFVKNLFISFSAPKCKPPTKVEEC